MRSAVAGLLLLTCSGCIGLDGVKPPSESKPAAREAAPESKPIPQAKAVSPEEITPANARQTVNALWQELDRAEEP